jgi:hypothetical protein
MHPGDVAPVFDYPRTFGTTVIGGAFSPASFGSLGGQYFFADFGASTIWSVVPTPAHDGFAAAPVTFDTNADAPVDLVFGPGNSMYYVAINTGTVHQVAPNYPRPRGASPIRVSLVPAYAQCTSTNSTHGAPLAFGSCAPPSQQSSFLTVGTPDSNGAQANSTGFVRLRAKVGDIELEASMTDVRNRAGLGDYGGELQVLLPIRITDLNNPPPAGGSGAATTQDGTFAFTVPCTTNSDPAVGSSCSVDTTANAVMPSAVVQSDRTIWQLGQIEVLDGGADGQASTNDNTVFARQGVFVP